MGGRGFGVEVLLCMCESRATFLSVPNKSLIDLETLGKIPFSVIGRYVLQGQLLFGCRKNEPNLLYIIDLYKILIS
jgi:hypothetical protein